MTGHPEITELDTTAKELLTDARGHDSRRTARTLVTGTAMRATLIALCDGATMAEHDAPPAATLQVVTGRVRLHTRDREWVLDAGHLVAVPHQRHGLEAMMDTVVLLTVSLR
jgi:quercetin dioxygenase-like cupin family protein